MKSKINVAFFGTSDRTDPIVQVLYESFNLVSCITKKDTHIGRHRELRETGVKKLAKHYNIHCTEVDSLNHSMAKNIIEQFSYSDVEYGVVADFSFIIPESIIEYFDTKLINIHFSLLPKYRGASPVQFSILNGDNNTGISYQLVHKRMDQGDIIQQIEYKIDSASTAGEVYNDLFKISAEHLPEVLNNYAKSKLKPKPQNESNASYTWSPSHPKRTTIYKEDAFLDLKKLRNLSKIHNAVRAYNPWPIAWTTLDIMENSVLLRSNLKDNVDRTKSLKIYRTVLRENSIEPIEVQVEGKKRMPWKDFKNGYVKT